MPRNCTDAPFSNGSTPQEAGHCKAHCRNRCVKSDAVKRADLCRGRCTECALPSACRKSLFSPPSLYSELQKVLNTADFNRAGNPSWVSRTHPSLPPRKILRFTEKVRGRCTSVHRPRCITTLYYTKTPQPGTPALSRLRRQNCGAAADGSCPSAAPHTGREPWGSRWTS